MNLDRVKRLATVSTFAIGVFTSASLTPLRPALAAPVNYELDSDIPLTVHVSVTVTETVNVATDDMFFGVIGVHQDKTGTHTATLTLDTSDNVTDDAVTSAASRLVAEGTGGASYVAPAAAIVDVTGAFPGALIYEHIENVTDLVCASGACTDVNTVQGTVDSTTIKYGTGSAPSANYVAPHFIVTDILDNMATPTLGGTAGGGQTPANGHWVLSPASNSDGVGVTDNTTGELKWKIGATISTVANTFYYASGKYHGTFDITLSY